MKSNTFSIPCLDPVSAERNKHSAFQNSVLSVIHVGLYIPIPSLMLTYTMQHQIRLPLQGSWLGPAAQEKLYVSTLGLSFLQQRSRKDKTLPLQCHA